MGRVACIVPAVVFGLAPTPYASAASFLLLPRVGTLGAGLDLGIGWSRTWSTRLSVNGFSYEYEAEETDVEYDGDLDLRTAGLLMDWHPFSGVFRLSGGVFYNGNEAHLVAKPTAGTYTVNDTVYTAAEIGSLGGKVDFRRASLYVGLGLGNAGRKG